jgi:multiple sugar transport system ATP-binding protein
MSTLTLNHIDKRFGNVHIIHDVNLHVGDGEFVVFVGPSGCGKSTLLRIIAGLETASNGEVKIDDAEVGGVAAAHRGCAMVFQSYALYPHMSVYANMAFGLENLNVPTAQIREKVTQAAKMLRLDALLERKPTQLSGGQRQRVAIGRAIVREPKIFLFDEPLSNLDAELRVSMRGELRELHQRLQATMIYVTHDQVEAMTLADKIVVLREGRIEQVGAPQTLYEKPCNTFVAGFIGSPRMNFVPRALFASNQTFNSQLANSAATIGVRPEHLNTERDANAPTLTLTVSHAEYLGGSQLVRGTASDGATPLEALVPTAQLARPGETLTLHFSPTNAHAFDAQGTRCA